MVATTEEELADLFEAAIVGMTPRVQYDGAQEWKPYDKEVGGPSRTRRFRQVWLNARLRDGGTMADNIFEHVAELRIRTDYAGDHSKTQFVREDDRLQLRDVLSTLKSEENGLLRVEPVRSVARDSFDENSDVTQVDHVFNVYYMRSIRP